MAKFFVGQRVVLVRARDFVSRAKNYGYLGTVCSFGCWHRGQWGIDGRIQFDCDVMVKWDELPRREYFQNTAQLEPILPEGAQPLGYSFEQMMSEFGVTEAVK